MDDQDKYVMQIEDFLELLPSAECPRKSARREGLALSREMRLAAANALDGLQQAPAERGPIETIFGDALGEFLICGKEAVAARSASARSAHEEATTAEQAASAALDAADAALAAAEQRLASCERLGSGFADIADAWDAELARTAERQRALGARHVALDGRQQAVRAAQRALAAADAASSGADADAALQEARPVLAQHAPPGVLAALPMALGQQDAFERQVVGAANAALEEAEREGAAELRNVRASAEAALAEGHRFRNEAENARAGRDGERAEAETAEREAAAQKALRAAAEQAHREARRRVAAASEQMQVMVAQEEAAEAAVAAYQKLSDEHA